MSSDLIQYAFVAGELSPKLYGRGDYEKFDFGLKQALNWFVDYRGGLTTRAGQHFDDFLQNPEANTRFFKFQFALDTANTYVVIFGDGYIRFAQSGAYVLESDITMTGATTADPVVITAAGHGLADGDWVKISDVVGMSELNGRTFEVSNKTTDTFELIDVISGSGLDGSDYAAYVSGGVINRIYTLVSPYDEADLPKLKVYQIRDYLRITHPDYPIKNLVRTAATNWSISNETIGSAVTRPSGLSAAASSSGSAGVAFAVTTVDADGNESIASDILLLDSIVNYASTAGQVSLEWTPVAGAAYYNIYRSIILTDDSTLNGALQLGYVGRSVGPIFVDNNIIPDFTSAPPQSYNPFANGAVDFITVTAGGSGYTSPPAVSVSGGGGSGFVGYSVLSGDEVVAVVVISGGAGYASPSVNFTGGGGSGATATATVGDTSGNYPATSALFQQRQFYAATANYPLNLYGSRIGQLSNFDVSAIQTSADALQFGIDAPTVAPIRHLVSMRGGLLAMSAGGIWQVAGVNGVLTAANAQAEPQTFLGTADVVPLFIDTDLLYVTEKESTIRLLAYNDYSKLYGGQDMSILSNHLFKAANPVKYWAYAETPFRLVHAIRADGVRLDFTIVKEQEVYAWTRATTKGFYKDVITVEEDGKDVTYIAVERYVRGHKVRTLEHLANREITNVEEAVCVDAALQLGATYPSATLIVSAVEGEVTLTAGSSIFSSGNVGDIIRGGGGKIEITAYTSGTVVTGYVLQELTDVIPETVLPRTLKSGEWTLDTPVTTVSGLWHLEGETVKILADGDVLEDQVVTDGTVNLTDPASRVIVGLGYTCVAETLPPVAPQNIIESRIKDIVGIAVRLHESRGLSFGRDLTDLEEMRDRTDEVLGEPTRLQNGIRILPVQGDWDVDATMFYQQSYPLPASILGLVTDLEVGDDRN